MKAVFFFDTVLYQDKSDYYGMTLTYEFFKNRYLINFDTIEVCTRVKDMSNIKGDISGYRKTNGTNVIVTPIKSYNEIPDSIRKNKHIKKEIENIIAKNDIVIVRMPSVIGLFACKIAQKCNKKYMIEMVACPWDGYMNHARFGGKILAPIMFIKTKKAVKNAPKVLYVTNEFLQKRYPTKGVSIACSDVVLPNSSEKILKQRISKINNMKNLEQLKLVTVANVGLKYKGQKYLIKALGRLRKKGINWHYYLIGGGDNYQLKKYVKKYNLIENVHFLGSLPHDEIFNKIDEMDLYIQPSLQEGLPRALLEALSRACPSIGSNAGGIPELLDSNMIFKKRNVSQLEKILYEISIEKLRKEAEKNFNKSLEYDVNLLEEKRNEFYANL